MSRPARAKAARADAVLVAIGALGGALVSAERSKYARSVFAPVFGNAAFDVVSSGQSGDGWTVCMAAVVTFDTTTTDTLPQSTNRSWGRDFGGVWQQTPILEQVPLEFCQSNFDHFDPQVVEMIRAASEAPGNWYIQPDASQVFMLWAPEQGLAARIYFGD